MTSKRTEYQDYSPENMAFQKSMADARWKIQMEERMNQLAAAVANLGQQVVDSMQTLQKDIAQIKELAEDVYRGGRQ